nr:retrotransposon protein, putative, unclassified [Oryza sativa Japonica Group]
MSYYVDPRTNGPQYPLYPVYGYPPSTVARQVGGLGAQGSTAMTSSLPDDNVNAGVNQGASTSTMQVWTQVGEIVFPVYTTILISTRPAIMGSENGVIMTPVDNPVSKGPPAQAEDGTSTTTEPEKDPNAAKSCPFYKKYEPTRTTSRATRAWCPIHRTSKHTLQACSVFFNVQAEIHACKERGIQRTSPTRDVHCPIHKTKNHDLSSCKVLLSAMKTSPPKVQQSQIPPRDTDKEQGEATTSDRFIGVIDIDPHEPSVLHLLEDQASSSTSTRRDVYAIDGTNTSRGTNAEMADETTTLTLAQHIRTLNAILRESPFDPVLNTVLDQWIERLRESVANLSNAFAEAAARTPPERPPTDVRWPEKFRPGAIEKYDGSTDPEEFLQVYSTILYAAGADDNALANYLPAALKGSARSWLVHLPPYLISSWADLWQQFVANFQGTYKRHEIEDNLHALTQNPGESLRDYIRRFNECRNTIPEITDASVIRVFKSGVRDHYTTQELATKRIVTARKLFEIVDRCAHVDDALRRKKSGEISQGRV